MNEMILHTRQLESNDWATFIFLVSLILIAVVSNVYEKRFSDFLRLGISDKYVKVYRESSNLVSGFNILLFVLQLISLSFFIQLFISAAGMGSKTDWILFVRIFTLTTSFVLIKFLIDKIIALTFNIEEFAEMFNLRKITYRTYFGLLLLPISFGLFFYSSVNFSIYLIVLALFLLANALIYLASLKNYQKFLSGKLFYFILYLCALEIAPYYFMYYWFTKS
ncbi:DUF4271 domain-containing protein [Flavobacterium ardleyense]|uniref:DUF4271 domain-containing protein n=1 Tax=Flavobacterium ardleyense TaxID=2038737 RepID=UPI00298C4D12|nr:DUF4271 domain-containing protein [Flavobacterium ardleyense]